MQLIYSFTTSLHLNIQGNDSIYKFCSKQESSINQGMEMKLSKRSLGNKHTDHKMYIKIHNLRNKTNLRTSKEGDSGRSFRDGLHLSLSIDLLGELCLGSNNFSIVSISQKILSWIKTIFEENWRRKSVGEEGSRTESETERALCCHIHTNLSYNNQTGPERTVPNAKPKH